MIDVSATAPSLFLETEAHHLVEPLCVPMNVGGNGVPWVEGFGQGPHRVVSAHATGFVQSPIGQCSHFSKT